MYTYNFQITFLLKYNCFNETLKWNFITEIELAMQGKILGLYTDGWIDYWQIKFWI